MTSTASDNIQSLLPKANHKHSDPADLERLRKFYEEMKAASIAKTREYDLPQLDTIGRSVYMQATRK